MPSSPIPPRSGVCGRSFETSRLRRVLKDQPRWVELTKRLVAPGILDQATADRVLGEAR